MPGGGERRQRRAHRDAGLQRLVHLAAMGGLYHRHHQRGPVVPVREPALRQGTGHGRQLQRRQEPAPVEHRCPQHQPADLHRRVGVPLLPLQQREILPRAERHRRHRRLWRHGRRDAVSRGERGRRRRAVGRGPRSLLRQLGEGLHGVRPLQGGRPCHLRTLSEHRRPDGRQGLLRQALGDARRDTGRGTLAERRVALQLYPELQQRAARRERLLRRQRHGMALVPSPCPRAGR